MNLQNSYFSIKNPLAIVDGWLHPFNYKNEISLNGKNLQVSWTDRAEQALSKRQTPLIVEMQIYFSCVIQKRVLFHEQSEHPTQPVNDKLNIALRPVQAESCDPVEFARNHPVSHELTSPAAKNLHPASLQIDFKHQQWCGEFFI